MPLQQYIRTDSGNGAGTYRTGKSNPNAGSDLYQVKPKRELVGSLAGKTPKTTTGYTAQYTTGSGYPDLTALLRKSYEASLANNQLQYDNTMKAAQAAYDSGAKQVNDAADKALREAYISKMITQRDMPQQLSANGMSGGLAESSVAKLANNYANNRAGVETGRMDSLGQLGDTLLQNQYSAANQLAERNAADAQNYYEQLAQQYAAMAQNSGRTATATTTQTTTADPETAYGQQLAAIYSGAVDYDTLAQNYLTLYQRFGQQKADELLKIANNQ